MHPELASADDTPESAVKSDEPDEVVDLVPYASMRLRITEFPTLK